MTRTEFEDNITEMWELIDFCNEHSLYECIDDVYSDEAYNDYVWDIIHDWGDDFESLRRWLDDLPTRYSDTYYIRDEYGDWAEAGWEEFTEKKSQVYDEALENDLFDPEEDEEEVEDTAAPEPVEEEIPEEPEWETEEFSMDMLWSMSEVGSSLMQSIVPEQPVTVQEVPHEEPVIEEELEIEVESISTLYTGGFGWSTCTVTTGTSAF